MLSDACGDGHSYSIVAKDLTTYHGKGLTIFVDSWDGYDDVVDEVKSPRCDCSMVVRDTYGDNNSWNMFVHFVECLKDLWDHSEAPTIVDYDEHASSSHLIHNPMDYEDRSYESCDVSYDSIVLSYCLR